MPYKPLRDYTLGDLQTVCMNNNQNCRVCIFRSIACHRTYPAHYDLNDKVVFTLQEISTAEELVRCFGDGVKVTKYGTNHPIKLVWFCHSWDLGKIIFPSLSEIDKYEISLKDVVEKGVANIE